MFLAVIPPNTEAEAISALPNGVKAEAGVPVPFAAIRRLSAFQAALSGGFSPVEFIAIDTTYLTHITQWKVQFPDRVFAIYGPFDSQGHMEGWLVDVGELVAGDLYTDFFVDRWRVGIKNQ